MRWQRRSDPLNVGRRIGAAALAGFTLVLGCGDDGSGPSAASSSEGGGATSAAGTTSSAAATSSSGPSSGAGGSGGAGVASASTGSGATSGTGGGQGAGPPACEDVTQPTEGIFAAPDGSPSGDGSFEAPWDLATALEPPVAPPPGTTVWLRGGTYPGGFVSKLDGASGAPIVVRSYPGEWATLDGATSPDPTLQIYHGFVTFRDLEIMSSEPDRTLDRPTGIYVEGNDVTLANLVVHDTGTGVIALSGAPDVAEYAPNLEIVGSLFYNNGSDGADRAHGHHVYVQNHEGTKRIVDNVLFHAFGFGIHAYAEGEDRWIQGYEIEGNVWFDNGAASATWDKLYDDCMLGHADENPVARVRVAGNFGWGPTIGERDVRMGWSAPNEDAVFEGNYIVGETTFQPSWSSLAIDGNTFVGPTSGFDPGAFPSNTYLSEPPSANAVFVRPNPVQPGRAHVVVYNWEDLDAVEVDLASVLAPGATYEVRNAQDFFAAPVASGTFDGAPVSIPMDGLGVAQPIGVPDGITAAEQTGRRFGVFVVIGCGVAG